MRWATPRTARSRAPSSASPGRPSSRRIYTGRPVRRSAGWRATRSPPRRACASVGATSRRRRASGASRHPSGTLSRLLLLAAGENPPQRRHQAIELDRLGLELVASGGERLLARTGERMRGERNDRNVTRVRIALEAARGLPAVDARHFKVHQHDVRPLGGGHLAALLAILGGEHLELVGELEPHLEHVDVVVVVFDVENVVYEAAYM